jgi:hypothetical protein
MTGRGLYGVIAGTPALARSPPILKSGEETLGDASKPRETVTISCFRLRPDDHDAQHGGEHQRQDRNVVARRAARICRIILDLTYRFALNAPLIPIEAWSVPPRFMRRALS